MKDKSTTYGLHPKKVIELLNIGKEISSPQNDIEQNKIDLLTERLNESVPLYFSAEEKPSEKLSYLRQTIAVLAGEPIGKLLLNPKTDITLIRMIKDYSKNLSEKSESEVEQHTANTIYYAAIAHAFVFYNHKITNHSYENLKKFYAHLLKEKWIPENLLELFKNAFEFCETMAKS